MSNFLKLIKKYCPEGVEFKKLGEVSLVSGAGVDKKINKDESPVTLLNYLDVYNNRYIDFSIPKMKVTASDLKIKQCNVLKGDIFITPTSEVLNDIGNSALAIEDLKGVVYSYHIMRIRIFDQNYLLPRYLNFLFESKHLQNQINKLAEGITRFGLTKPRWEGLSIPIPPLPVQEEIVKILDTFSALTAELQARKKQYEYYRNHLLTFSKNDPKIKWMKLGEVGEFYTGKQFNRNDLLEIAEFPCMNGGINASGYSDKWNENENTIIISQGGASAGYVNFITQKFWAGAHCYVIKPDLKIFINKFFYYYLKNNEKSIMNSKHGAGIPGINRNKISSISIPIPPLPEQERIVGILDKFDTLVNDLSNGIPAEISARQQQYEYYRNLLLTFEEKK